MADGSFVTRLVTVTVEVLPVLSTDTTVFTGIRCATISDQT